MSLYHVVYVSGTLFLLGYSCPAELPSYLKKNNLSLRDCFYKQIVDRLNSSNVYTRVATTFELWSKIIDASRNVEARLSKFMFPHWIQWTSQFVWPAGSSEERRHVAWRAFLIIWSNSGAWNSLIESWPALVDLPFPRGCQLAYSEPWIRHRPWGGAVKLVRLWTVTDQCVPFSCSPLLEDSRVNLTSPLSRQLSEYQSVSRYDIHVNDNGVMGYWLEVWTRRQNNIERHLFLHRAFLTDILSIRTGI
jgi:hypothetical protein